VIQVEPQGPLYSWARGRWVPAAAIFVVVLAVNLATSARTGIRLLRAIRCAAREISGIPSKNGLNNWRVAGVAAWDQRALR
jgi:hypothetical protein